jgi:hypothetical protein
MPAALFKLIHYIIGYSEAFIFAQALPSSP